MRCEQVSKGEHLVLRRVENKKCKWERVADFVDVAYGLSMSLGLELTEAPTGLLCQGRTGQGLLQQLLFGDSPGLVERCT